MARPRKLTPEQERIHWQDGEEFVHRRTMRNNFFMNRALEILAADGLEKYGFLIGVKDGKRRIRKTLLSELGRFADEAILLRNAEYLCLEKPTTADGIDYMRISRGVHGHYAGD
ncbi:MAG: hypothetical protein WKF90_11060 [Pyrinomonadaceae bacterium]